MNQLDNAGNKMNRPPTIPQDIFGEIVTCLAASGVRRLQQSTIHGTRSINPILGGAPPLQSVKELCMTLIALSITSRDVGSILVTRVGQTS